MQLECLANCFSGWNYTVENQLSLHILYFTHHLFTLGDKKKKTSQQNAWEIDKRQNAYISKPSSFTFLSFFFPMTHTKNHINGVFKPGICKLHFYIYAMLKNKTMQLQRVSWDKNDSSPNWLTNWIKAERYFRKPVILHSFLFSIINTAVSERLRP